MKHRNKTQNEDNDNDGDINEDISENAPEDPKTVRRPKSTLFNFSPMHPLHLTYIQRMRSKLYILVLSGLPPPSLKQLDSPQGGYSKF